MQPSLEPLFAPRGVAVVGASRDPASVGHRVLTNLLRAGFAGPVFPVNPNAEVIASMPAYPSVHAIPLPVDLAVIALPAPLVPGAVDDCARKGVKALVVLSAGFAETGAAGRALEEQLLAKVRAAGMRMVGPNCLGILNTDPAVCLNATFAPQAPAPGVLAMSSQSGALGLAILDHAQRLGLGLAAFVSVGNRADISSNDLLEYWRHDPRVRVVLLYLESFGNPRKFARIARSIAREKPVVAVKSGRSQAGSRAASSHTAALASSDVGAAALFRQAGVLRVDTLEEMFEVAAVLAHQPLPQGNRVAVLTNAGGPAILCVDVCEAMGLAVPPLAAATQQRLREFLPGTASVTNPVDMVAAARADEYAKALPLLLADPGIDAVIVLYIVVGPGEGDAVAAAIASAPPQGKPLVACLMGGHRTLHGIPCYAFPESAARALARAWERSQWLQEPAGTLPHLPGIEVAKARALLAGASGWLLPDACDALLRCFGIATVPTRLCAGVEQAVAAAEALGYPVAVKLASRTLVHKSEWNGVRLKLRDAAAVREAFAGIAATVAAAGKAAEFQGVAVQAMAPDGAEVMVGMTLDPSFGPLVGFGLGGITVELLGDVVFRITPLTDRDAWAMVRGIRGRKLLEGFRGAPRADQEALVDLLLRISVLAETLPELQELDLNPVRVFAAGKGLLVLDARIRV